MEQRNVGAVICKVLFILMLVLTVIGTAIYLPVSISVRTAKANQTAPKLMGYYFIPMEQEGWFEQIGAGSIVLAKSPQEHPPVEGATVIYRSADGAAHAVYEGLSIASIARVDETTGEKIYTVVTRNNLEHQVQISENDIIAVGSNLLDGMVPVFYFLTSINGLIALVVIPGVLFLLFLALFLVFRARNQQPEGKEKNKELEVLEKEEGPLYQEPKTSSSNDLIGQTQTVSTSPLVSPTHQPGSGGTPGVLPVQEEEESLLSLDDMRATMMMDSVSGTGEQQPAKPVQGGTMEFDLSKLEEELMSEPKGFDFKQEDENADILENINNMDKELSQINELEDNVMFLVKEDSIDVSFKNIISMDIDIENHADGSGFVIKTPKYDADITVKIISK